MNRALLAVLLVACGKNVPAQTDAPPGGGSDAATDGAAAGWTPLISRPWSLAAGQTNIYECHRFQVPTDMWISGYRAVAPPGTHHEVISISTTSSPLGDYDCSAQQVATEMEMLYAAGIMTDDLVFPTGVAFHLKAGQYINLNLHLFNATDAAIAGTSGVEVKTIAAADVVHEADMTFSGTATISVPADGQPHTAQGGCTANRLASTDLHVFALWPHMHQIATHQMFSVNGAPVLDTPYTFTEQKNYPMNEMVIHPSDAIQTTCTYVNNTGATVNFGDQSTDEMCFTGMYKYPTSSGLFGCVS